MYKIWMAATDPTNESETYKMVGFVWGAYQIYMYSISVHTQVFNGI